MVPMSPSLWAGCKGPHDAWAVPTRGTRCPASTVANTPLRFAHGLFSPRTSRRTSERAVAWLT